MLTSGFTMAWNWFLNTRKIISKLAFSKKQAISQISANFFSADYQPEIFGELAADHTAIDATRTDNANSLSRLLLKGTY